MCTKGVNAGQLKLMIAQANDSLALTQQWLEQIHHMAGHADLDETGAEIAQASALLNEARTRLEGAAAAAEGQPVDSGVQVELV